MNTNQGRHAHISLGAAYVEDGLYLSLLWGQYGNQGPTLVLVPKRVEKARMPSEFWEMLEDRLHLDQHFRSPNP